MSEIFRKGRAPAPPDIRDALFGDLPLSEWPRDSSPSRDDEPWASFRRARELLERSDAKEAAEVLRAVTRMPGLESRHYVEAWHALRRLGVSPQPSEEKRVFGVVVEVGMKKGVDIVAAYEDRSARYFNFSGAGVVWDRPSESLDAFVDALLAAGRLVVSAIGPWLEPRPPAPRNGYARMSFLTPSGLHFGQGPFDALARDSLAAPVIAAATELMKRLIEKSEERKS